MLRVPPTKATPDLALNLSGSLPGTDGASPTLPELLYTAATLLQARGGGRDHIQAFHEILSSVPTSPRKTIIQFTRAFAAESTLPPIEAFRAVCHLLQHRLRHHPDVGWRELQGTIRGYAAFLAASPSEALAEAGSQLLFRASERGFALAHLAPIVALTPRLESCGAIPTGLLCSLFQSTLESASKKHPADLPALLGRGLTREALRALAGGRVSPSICATLHQVIPSWIFDGVLRVVGELAQGDVRQRGIATACASLILAVAGTDESLGWPSEAPRARVLGYWGEPVLRAMQSIAELAFRAAKETSAEIALKHISSLASAGVPLVKIFDHLHSINRVVDLESWLAREAPFAEIAADDRSVTPIPTRAPFPPLLMTVRRDLIPALNQAFDLARGYDVLREELSPGFGIGLLPSRLVRFGQEVASCCLPLSPRSTSSFPGGGVAISGIAPEIFSPLKHGMVGDLGHAIQEAANSLGNAPSEIQRATFLVAQHLFAIVGRDSSRYTIRGEHYSYLITPDGPHNPSRHAGWLVPTELVVAAILRPLREGTPLLAAALHPQLLTPQRHGIVAFTGSATVPTLPAEVGFAELLTRYHHLAQLFRLRLALWHKGQSLDSGRRPFFSASSIPMLEECFQLHHLGHALGYSSGEFPQLMAAPTFQYRNLPLSPFTLDTSRLVLHCDGAEYPLPRNSDGRGSAEFRLWHRHVVPYLSHVGTDLRFQRR